MKVVHVECGLGNQMLDYATYLAVKDTHPDEKCYIEKLFFDLPDSPGIFNRWNGFELSGIFDIEYSDIKELFNEREWNTIVRDFADTRFWESEWSAYARHVKVILGNYGIELNIFKEIQPQQSLKLKYFRNIRSKDNLFIWKLNRLIYKYKSQKKSNSRNLRLAADVFERTQGDLYYPRTFSLMYKNSGIERIENVLRRTYTFPEIEDLNNLAILDAIRRNNSVSIHARRSDFLQYNQKFYKYGYFKKAASFIKKNVSNPLFVIFSDDINWCRANTEVLGLDKRTDNVLFVDWNTGSQSYIDMQLMSECKHNIISNSSFGWWATWLNKYPDKITCSPIGPINTTHQF